MFGRKPKVEDTQLEREMIRILDEMNTTSQHSEEYPKLLASLERINRLRTAKTSRKLTPDVVIQAVAPLFGILILVAYEQKHVITSKGMNFIKFH